MPNLQINSQRLLDDINTLATFTEPDTPGWTRRFPSEAYVRGRKWLRARMEAEGLRTRQDAAGNLFAQREGAQALPPIYAGSHTDTVMGGGRYDGILGVLGALESARAIREAGIELRHPFVVADYLSEEATDYGIACMGSMIACTRDFKPEWLTRKVGETTLHEAIAQMGGQPDAMFELSLNKGDVAASL